MRAPRTCCVVLLLAAATVLPVGAAGTIDPICGQAGDDAAAGRPELRVATYNVLHGNTEEPPSYPAHSTLDERLDMSIDQIVDERLDVLGMQEVAFTAANDRTAHRPGNVAAMLADGLAEETGERWYWCWALANPHFPGEPDVNAGGGGPISDELARRAYASYASFKEGEAVVSRFPIVDAEAIRLPRRVQSDQAFCDPGDTPGCQLANVFESRIALWASVAAPGGSIQIITTHLSNDADNATALSTTQQAAAVLAFSDAKAAQQPHARRFIVCDCNVEDSSSVPVVSMIEASGWTDVHAALHPGEAGFTNGDDVIVTEAPQRVLDARIDYVFARGGTCRSPISGSEIVIDEPAPFGDGHLWPSDHLAVTADFAACA